MGCFQADKPGNLNYAKILDQTLQTQVGLQPLLQAANAQWDPVQTNQALTNLNDLLFGSNGGSFDVQTFRPTISQTGNALNYGPTPKGFTGEVIKPSLGTARNPGPGITGPTATPRKLGDGSTGLGLTGSSAGDATVLGGPLGMGFGGFADNGNPDPLSSALGVGFWGGPPTNRLAGPQYGTRTVTQGAQPGLIEMMNQAAKATQAGTIDRLNTLGPDARAAILAANPDMASLLDKLNTQAGEGLDAGSGLTPDEERIMQQQARASWAARGLDGSPGAAADEILRQFALGQNLKGQRQAFAQSVVGQDQSTLENPIFQLLTQGSNALPQAQSLLPGQLFNPESPFAGNIASANQQMAALFADPSTLSKINQTTQTVGNVVGTVGQIAGGIAGI